MLTEYLPIIFIAIGLFAISIGIFLSSAKSKLKQTGILVDGIIFEQSLDNSFNNIDNSNPVINDKITIRFLTKKEEWITGILQQEFKVFYTGQYKDGDTIKVYYDEMNPNDFYVDTKQSEIVGRIMFVVTGIIFTLIGLYKLLY